MKKIKLGVFLLTISLTTLTGCATSNNDKDTKDTKSTASSSTVTKETSSSSTEASSTKQSSTATDTDPLSLMIEASQSQIPSLMEQFGSMYSDIAISKGEGDTLVYTYTYSQQVTQQVDAEALKPTLAKGLKSTMDMAKAVVPDIKIQVIYLNPDKSEVANITITQEDTDNVQ